LVVVVLEMGRRDPEQAAIKAELPERFEYRGNTFAGFDFDFQRPSKSFRRSE
jgi:hypothetical protein